MTPVQAYVLAKKVAEKIGSGISDITLEGTTLTFNLASGGTISMDIPLPENGKDGPPGKEGAPGKNGASVVSLAIDPETNHLKCTLSDDTVVDAGEIPVPEDMNLYWDIK